MSNAISVVFMGDSITFGQHIDPSLRWTSIIDSIINKKFLDSAINFAFINSGISGNTTRQGLERFPSDVQSHHPDIVTIQFGLNDCNCWFTDKGMCRVSEAAFQANLNEMIMRAQTFNAKSIILLTNHRTLRHKRLLCEKSLEEKNKEYNEIIRTVADKNDVYLCDMEKSWSALSTETVSEYLLEYPDLLHLSEKGHQFYAEIVLPYIEKSIEMICNNSYIKEIKYA